jgi:hypothetical protein
VTDWEYQTKRANVERLLRQVRIYRLHATPEFHQADILDLVSAYNGAGPDTLGWIGPQTTAKIRKILTVAYWFFEPAFLIHDWDFQMSGEKFDRQISNECLRRNLAIIIEAEINPWLSPIMWIRRKRQAWCIVAACRAYVASMS